MADFDLSDPVGSLDKMSEQLQQKAQRYGQFQARLNEVTVSRTSSDGRVRITVDSNGVPTEITLTDRARGVDPAELTRGINSTLRSAQAELRAEVENLAGEIVGDDEPANNILSQYQTRFPDVEGTDEPADVRSPEMRIGELADEPDEVAVEPPTRPARRTRDEGDDVDDEDDWSGRSIFE